MFSRYYPHTMAWTAPKSQQNVPILGMRLSRSSQTTQIQSEREVRAGRHVSGLHLARRVAKAEKPRQAAAFRLIRIDGKGGVTPSARIDRKSTRLNSSH